MASVTFKCTLITPLFMSGADQSEWEIRPQSIKGMMAFWWRAMNAHVPLDDITDEAGNVVQKGLRTLEGELFGSTSQKSRFKIRVNSNLSPEERMDNFTYQDIKYFDVKYLLFSTRKRIGASDTNTNKKDTAFKLKLSSANKTHLQKAVSCFWLLSNLGGLGSRSRRGGGNLFATVLEEEADVVSSSGLHFGPNPGLSMRDYLHNNFQACKKLLHEEVLEAHRTIDNSYSHLEGAQLVLGDNPQKQPMDALNKLGEFYLDFRQDDTLTGEVGNLIQKAPLGLPIVTKDKVTVKPENYDRRASPLIFRVVRNERGAYQWIVLKLSGHLLPPGEATIAQNRGNTLANVPELSRDIIDEFFDYLQNDKTELVAL